MEFYIFSSRNWIKPLSGHCFLFHPLPPSSLLATSLTISEPSPATHNLLYSSFSIVHSCSFFFSFWGGPSTFGDPATGADLFWFLSLTLIWLPENNFILPAFPPFPSHITLSSKRACSLFLSSLLTPNRTPQGACQINLNSAKEIQQREEEGGLNRTYINITNEEKSWYAALSVCRILLDVFMKSCLLHPPQLHPQGTPM